ncbi:MAG: UV DNA damage repair endonuclease UvsE, partial [Pseudomonadota bacterium]
MIRLGLCCQFVDAPIKFRTTTVTACKRLSKADRLAKLSGLCRANAEALFSAFQYCIEHQIGCFRVNSQILPVKTHNVVGYDLEDLPDVEAIVSRFKQCGELATKSDLRVSFHPDQFVVLNSPRPDVVRKSIAELEYQSEV